MMDLSDLQTLMRWETPSIKTKWCARMVGASAMGYGMTADEAVNDARRVARTEAQRRVEPKPEDDVSDRF